jgi:hypothetical protein
LELKWFSEGFSHAKSDPKNNKIHQIFIFWFLVCSHK